MSEPSYIEPLFETLSAVGYTICKHPRRIGYECQDCGALWSTEVPGRLLVQGHMGYRRKPIAYTTGP